MYVFYQRLVNEILANLFKMDIPIRNFVLLIKNKNKSDKTEFIKYLINAFQKKNNIKLSEVTSPTFNLLNEYEINQVKINHYDLFRLKSPEEVKNLNLFESYSKAITLIEWPQIIKEKPKNLIELQFYYEDDHKKRSVQIKGLDLS